MILAVCHVDSRASFRVKSRSLVGPYQLAAVWADFFFTLSFTLNTQDS